jgi:hypothetical protein
MSFIKSNICKKYNSCYEAAKDNNLNDMIKLHQSGYSLKFICLTEAVKNNNVEMLDYLLRHDCPNDQSLTITIAVNNRTDVLHYLINNNLFGTGATQIEWHPDTTDFVIEYSKGDLTLLKYYINSGCPFSDHITEITSRYGYLHCLKYAVENGAYKHPNAINNAIQYNQKECFHYLLKQKFVITSDITITAASYGRIELLKYLINVCKVEWYPSTTAYAAQSGNIEVLMYCLQNGCPNHSSTIYHLRQLDSERRLNLDFDNTKIRLFVFELYHSHPELRTCYFGKRIKEEMDTIEMKKNSIRDCISNYVCNDLIQYCIYTFI